MATRYWVGGAGSKSFQDTANWSATRGGAGGATAPTGTDEAFIESGTSDINSGLSNAGFTGQLTVSAGFSGTIGTIGGSGLIANLANNGLRYSGNGRFAYFGGAIFRAYIYGTQSDVRFVSGSVGGISVGNGCQVQVVNGVSVSVILNGGGFVRIGTNGVGTFEGLAGSAVCVGSAANVNLSGGRFEMGGTAPITNRVNVLGSSAYNHKSTGTINTIYVGPDAVATTDGARSGFTVTESARWIGSRFFDPSFVSITFTIPTLVEGGTF
jgi:hypothetical protein